MEKYFEGEEITIEERQVLFDKMSWMRISFPYYVVPPLIMLELACC